MRGERLKGLNAIRALCALFILWGHVSQPDFCRWEIVSLPLPDCCAYVFFVISGFLAGYRIDKAEDGIAYYGKKARRILPLYYSYLAISVLVYLVAGQSDEVFDSRLLYYFFLVPQIPFCKAAGILPLVHLWFIGTIVLFYCLFPVFTKLKADKRVTVAAIIVVLWLFLKLVLRFTAGQDASFYRFVGVTSLDVLFSGVWAGLLLREGSPWLEKVKRMKWLGVAAWLLFLSSGVYGRLIPAPVRVEFVALLTLVIIITQQAERPFPNLEIKFMEWLGAISYEIYVTQILVIVLLSCAYTKIGVEIPAIAIYLICTVVVTGISWCFHQALKHK